LSRSDLPTPTRASIDRAIRLNGLPQDESGPVFAQPWHAETFAMVIRLSETGHFTWREWTETLGAVLGEAGQDDDGSHYYDHWLTALERIVTSKRLVQAWDLENRKVEWIEAYGATPHGQPVELHRY
jgi:nitrile hydratase accessory protein